MQLVKKISCCERGSEDVSPDTHETVEIFKGMDKGGSPYFWLYETSVGSQVTGSQVDLNRDGIVWTVVLLRHCLLHCLVFHGWLAGWCLMIPF